MELVLFTLSLYIRLNQNAQGNYTYRPSILMSPLVELALFILQMIYLGGSKSEHSPLNLLANVSALALIYLLNCIITLVSKFIFLSFARRMI